MLFDLRSRGRRRTVQVIYLGLAILIGGGLILFGVGTGTGGGGLLNGLNGNASNSGQNQAISQATRAALRQVKANPNSTAAWYALEQAYWSAAAQDSATTSTIPVYSAAGKQFLAKTTDAWRHYSALTKNPSSDAAILAARAYGYQGQYKPEASAWQFVIQSNPSSAKGYECLAFAAYAGKQTRVGDLASEQAIKRAPKLQQLELKNALKSAKTQPLYAQTC